MGFKFKSYYLIAIALIGMSPFAVHSAETGVQFSGYVPAKSGDLSFGPMQAYAESTGTKAGLRLMAGNNSTEKAQLSFEAFDGHFNRVNHVDLPNTTTLYPGETRNFLAVVPIMQDVKSRYRICAVLKSPSAKDSRMCGKYIAQKR